MPAKKEHIDGKKYCCDCDNWLELEQYNKHKNRWDGLQRTCKECIKKYREQNKEKINNKNKEYYENNKENINKKRREYHENNKEKMSNRKKEYRENNKEKIINRNKEYIEKNKEKILNRNKEYIEKNKEKRNNRYREYIKNRYHNDPAFRISVLTRGRVLKAIKTEHGCDRTHDLLGCSPQHAKEHIESQFEEGMTWENHSLEVWHIDHIIPVCQFDMTDIEEVKKCFHYTNLQPLWAKDNLEKGGRIS